MIQKMSMYASTEASTFAIEVSITSMKLAMVTVNAVVLLVLAVLLFVLVLALLVLITVVAVPVGELLPLALFLSQAAYFIPELRDFVVV